MSLTGGDTQVDICRQLTRRRRNFNYQTQGTNVPPQLLSWSFRETSEEKNICPTRQTLAKYNRSWHSKVIETKSRQIMVFDPGGLSGCLCGSSLWEGDARCTVRGLIREAFAIRHNYLCFFLVFSMYQNFPESALNSGPEPRPYLYY